MAQTVIITVNTIGPGTGPFKIYSLNNAGVVSGPFETGVTRAQLLAGFVSTNVPDDAVTIRVVSNAADCPISLDIYLNIITTTTTVPPTTTSTTSTSTTTSTTSTSTTTTVQLFPFIIKASNITKFSISSFSSSLDVEIDYGTRTVFVPAGQNITNISNTYATQYTGDIIIRCANLAAITKLEIAANDANDPTKQYILPQQTGTILNPGGFPAYITGTELNKLTGLITLNISNVVFISNAITINFARTLSSINVLWADVSGSIEFLPNAIPLVKTGVVSILNLNTLSGDIARMPPSYYVISIGGSNTISGDIKDIQAHVASFAVLGNNTLTGDLADLPNSYSSINGVTNCILTSINIQGFNTITGNIREIDIERMRFLSITGEENPDNGNIGGNTISGTIDADLIDTRLWNVNLSLFQILGKNTITGFLSSLTRCAALTRISIDGKLGTSAGNTIAGDLTDLPTISVRTNNNLNRLILAGNNTVTGDLLDISNFTVLRTIILTGRSLITGTLSDLPLSTYELTIDGESNINTYPSRKEKANPMSRFAVKPKTLTGNYLSVIELEQLIIDLDQTIFVSGSRAWEKGEGIIVPYVFLYGNSAFTNPAAITAKDSLEAKLIAKGGSLIINTSTARDIEVTMYDCYNTQYSFYSDCEIIGIGCTLYQDVFGTPVYPGYYKASTDSYATVYEVDSSGLLINISSCF